jgi:hypothetical protein
MKTVRCAMVCAVVSMLSVNSVASVGIDDGSISNEPIPYWVEGGSYTAELDLSTQRLKLYPLLGESVEIAINGACTVERSQGALPEGVYVVHRLGEVYELRASYYQGENLGASLLDIDTRSLADCQSVKTGSDLSLPTYALNLLEAYDVGAIYLHR